MSSDSGAKKRNGVMNECSAISFQWESCLDSHRQLLTELVHTITGGSTRFVGFPQTPSLRPSTHQSAIYNAKLTDYFCFLLGCVTMAALWNRAGHYFLPCDFCLSSSFFPLLISTVRDWMSTVFPHMVWPWCEFKNACLKCAARCSLKYRTQKIAILVPSHNFVGLYLRN